MKHRIDRRTKAMMAERRRNNQYIMTIRLLPEYLEKFSANLPDLAASIGVLMDSAAKMAENVAFALALAFRVPPDIIGPLPEYHVWDDAHRNDETSQDTSA